MILRRLRYFSSVAEHGTIVGAAKALRLAQPSLSRQIQALERDIGVALLERARRGIRVTPAGQTLLDAVRAITARLQEGLQRAQQAHEGTLGSVRIALGRAAVHSKRVAGAIASLRTTLPNVTLEIDEIGSFAQVPSLYADNADLMIGVRTENVEPRIVWEPLFDEIIDCAMLSSSHPLAHEEILTPERLRDETLLLIDPAVSRGFPGLYEPLSNIHSGPVEYVGTVDSLYSLVAVGRGWTPASRETRESPPPSTIAVPLQGLEVRLTMAASWRRDKRSRLISNVVAVLRASLGEEGRRPDLRIAERSRPIEPRKTPFGLEARHLLALTTTVAEGSVNRAAPRLGLTQSGLSRRLRSLEREIGIPLFRRGPSGIVPSHAGLVFRGDAAAILEILDRAIAVARNDERKLRRPCRIGVVPSEIAGDLMLSVVRHMTERHPEVPVEVVELTTSAQASGLLDREIDVGLAKIFPGSMEDPAIASVQIGYDAVDSALLSTSHPLASRTWLRPADLADVPFLFITRSLSPRFYDSVMEALEQIGLTPRIEGRFNGLRALWQLTAASMGWTVGSRRMRLHPPAGLVAIPIEGLRIPLGMQVLWRRDEEDPRVKMVLDAFRAGDVV